MSTGTRLRETGRVALALVCAVLAVTATASATEGTESDTAADRPIVLMIHADWCGTCRVLGPVWEQIQADFADNSTVVVFDVTDRNAYAESAQAAKALGVEDFFSKHRAKTGTIAVLACNSHEPVAVLKGERDIAVYRAALAKAACETP